MTDGCCVALVGNSVMDQWGRWRSVRSSRTLSSSRVALWCRQAGQLFYYEVGQEAFSLPALKFISLKEI